MSKEGILYFHQGWTDIINCLALINYYGSLYDKIYLIMRADAKPIVSDIFFDTIQVLENALEIHLLDSVWGAFIYQLDAKYKLFQNKKIVLYAKRGYIKMFEEPIKLTNWIII